MTDPFRRITEMVARAPKASAGETAAAQEAGEDAREPAIDPCDDLGPSDADNSGADPNVVARCASLDHSDTDNGKRLIAHFGRDLIVMAQGGTSGGDYLGWTGTHWDLDGGLARATMAAQRVGGRIALEAAHLDYTPDESKAIKAEAPFSGDDERDEARAARAKAQAARKALKARQAARWRFAVTSKNKGRYTAMLDAAAPHLRRAPDDFNADIYLVATQTHTLRFVREEDPGSGEVPVYVARAEASAEHRREDLITALVPVDYDKAATAPKWQAFLDECLPNKDVRRTVQQYSGTGLLGVLLQRLMFHHGFGANGKSVFLEVLTRLLGESFAVGLPAESIVGTGERNAGGASPDIVRLFGKRMVRVLELPEGAAVREDLVKRLTGGEKFPVRTLFKGYFEFQNRATPHMSGNGFPKIDGTDNGIWRRMLVVHWSVVIPEERRRDFEEFVGDLLTERAGILNWLIEGALDYLTNGLVISPEIATATASYREDMDPIGRFVTDCVEAAAGEHVGARTMYEAYKSWCMANALSPRFETKFGLEMKKRFVKDEKRTRSYLDCRLHDVPARPDAAAKPPDDFPEDYAR